MWPSPPVSMWPPPQPVYPELPIYIAPPVAGHPLPEPPDTGNPPDYGISLPPGVVYPPLPGIGGPVLVFVWIPGYGYRWTVIDPSLSIGGGPVVPEEPEAAPKG